MERPDVLIIGASLGGVAAAISAKRRGARVVLIERSSWVGGQLTSQGVCTPDENRWIETGGGTATYQRLRGLVRAHYTRSYRINPIAPQPVHPGDCWVSGISAEPRVWEAAIRELLIETDVDFRTHCRISSIKYDGCRICHVSGSIDGQDFEIEANIVIDATDFGDVAPMAGLPFRIGAESRTETGEPDAPRIAHTDRRQPITFPSALELRPNCEKRDNVEPRNYLDMKALQHYHTLDGAMKDMWGMYGWWNYRRVIASHQFEDPRWPCDVAMINTVSNDWRGGPLPCDEPETHAQRLAQARDASLGYIRWLQTECPRDDGGFGYPELLLRGDWFGTSDGLSAEPYVRESRRLRTRTTIREQDVISRDLSGRLWQRGPRSRFWPDSVGIGHYWLDIHSARADDEPMLLHTLPFQIPLGAFICRDCDNLIPACKNIGATRLGAAALRLHPIEWAIGEAAGELAALCAERNLTSSAIAEDGKATGDLQLRLVRGGAPIYWWTDLSPSHPAFEAAQMLAIRGDWPWADTLEFHPDLNVDEYDTEVTGLVRSSRYTRTDMARELWNRVLLS